MRRLAKWWDLDNVTEFFHSLGHHAARRENRNIVGRLVGWLVGRSVGRLVGW